MLEMFFILIQSCSKRVKKVNGGRLPLPLTERSDKAGRNKAALYMSSLQS